MQTQIRHLLGNLACLLVVCVFFFKVIFFKKILRLSNILGPNLAQGFVGRDLGPSYFSDFIWPFLRPYMGVIPNPKMAFIFPISCILALIFPISIKYFPKCVGKGSFPKFQIKSLYLQRSSAGIKIVGKLLKFTFFCGT